MTNRELPGGRLLRTPDLEDGAEIDGGDYRELTAEGSIDRSTLRNIDLSGVKLGPMTFTDVAMRNVDMSNAALQQVVARRTEIVGCRAIGLRLSVELATDLSIMDCKLDYATIHLEKVKGVAVFEGCSFREATISGDLSNTMFLDCDFVATEFRARSANKCDLRTSRLTEAHGLLSLKGATISMDQAVAISAMIASEAGLIVAD